MVQKTKSLGKYIPANIERKWQEAWGESELHKFKLDPKKKNYYNLVELPYPSGDLHFGHWFTFSTSDVHARFKRMTGLNVFYPPGFDAFGLPAENAAIKRNIHPRDWTMDNIKTMTGQFETMGTSLDWSHQAITCEPEYYKWNQWIFLKMYERGLAYRGKSLSNWCPSCQTVLANEGIENGKCWRCGSIVDQKEIEQWFLKITEYAERLLWPTFAKASAGKTNASAAERIPFDNCIIVHGCPQSADDLIPKENRWMNWLEKELQSRGATAVALDMPTPWEPDYKAWKRTLENENITKDTVFVGHSCGAAFLVRWLLETKKKIKKLILVAPAKLPDTSGDRRIDLYEFELPKKATEVAEEAVIFISNDQERHIQSAKMYEKALNGRVVEFEGKQHFVYRQTGIYEFPELLSEVLSSETAKQSTLGSAHVDWPQSVREGQNNWIGKSEGLEIDFPLVDSKEKITVFTVYPETIYGVTYIVLAPEHPIVGQIANSKWQIEKKRQEEVKECVETAKRKTEMERKELKDKTGVFTGLYAINPLTNQRVPIWVADYVIATYGTGAVMGVPGSDERDFAFAKAYDLSVKRVIGESKDDTREVKSEEDVLEDGILVNSSEFSGLDSKIARKKISEYIQSRSFGRGKTQYHLRDWSISRQRYWGTPVPIIYCRSCWEVKSEKLKVKSEQGRDYAISDGKEHAIIPVPLEALPVELPYEVDYKPKGKPPLATAEKWLNVTCPKCGGKAKRDVETLDTFFDSSWYYYRYVDPHFDKGPFNPELVRQLTPVDIYFGGQEHNVGHTMYARFFTKFFHDLGLLDFEEFAKKRVQHGIVLGTDGYRMSKSRGNVVSPDEIVKEYGADTVRIYLSFMMPYDGVAPWSTGAISGVFRFLKRIWDLYEKLEVRSEKSEVNNEDLSHMHRAIKKVGEDIDTIKFNTAVAALMEWLNYLSRKEKISRTEYETMLLLLAPFAPHFTEELWHELGYEQSIHLQSWPKYDTKLVALKEKTIIVQVNGRVRATLTIGADTPLDKAKVEALALENERVKKYLQGQKPKKTIYVPEKIINFVL